MNPAGVLCDMIFVLCVLWAGPVLLVTGGAGTVATSWARTTEKRPIFIVLLVLGILGTLWTVLQSMPADFWSGVRPPNHLGDNELELYQHAIAAIDRETLGFTSISKDADIKVLTGNQIDMTCPDVELVIQDAPIKSQYICLKEESSTWYTWHSEYEVYQGPDQSQSIWLAYSSAPNVMGMSGVKPYPFMVEYRGPRDPRLPDRALTLADVRPIIDEWKAYHLAHP